MAYLGDEPSTKDQIMRLRQITQAFVLLLASAFAVHSHATDNRVLDNLLPMPERMAQSEMQRNPQAWSIDWRTYPRWTYTHGLVLLSFAKVYEKTGKIEYFNYIQNYVDSLINEHGDIATYDINKYNIDMVNPGKLLFFMYQQTGKNKYKIAADTLRQQLRDHPRTSEGGFWHKQRYTSQMWLDGLYMGSPFYAQYIHLYEQPKVYDDVILQFEQVEKHLYRTDTGLPVHGWDESKNQRWADKKTGQSTHHWSRAVGWYAMAMVDVLEFLPQQSTQRKWLAGRFNNLVRQMAKYQHTTGLWYQVVELPNAKDNYLEASGSIMMAYAILKADKMHDLQKELLPIGLKAYQGVIDQLISSNQYNHISINQVCAVAGLGGEPYRDGSYEYYISEPVRADDPKAVGPFILASLLIEERQQALKH